MDAEDADKTRHPKIFVGRFRPHAWESVQRHIAELASLAHERVEDIRAKLRAVVPEYHPDPHAAPAGTPSVRPERSGAERREVEGRAGTTPAAAVEPAARRAANE